MMSTAEVAIVISLGSMLVAATSLAWNIYRDVVRKPKLRITLMVGQITHPTFQKDLHRVVVTVTNFGPAKTQAHMLQLRKSSWWRRLLRRQTLAILMPSDDALSGRLPAALDMGEKVVLTFPFTSDLFVRADFTQLGISDAFGKVYWCSKRDYRRAQESYQVQSRQLPSG